MDSRDAAVCEAWCDWLETSSAFGSPDLEDWLSYDNPGLNEWLSACRDDPNILLASKSGNEE